jgi:hypothetical protein
MARTLLPDFHHTTNNPQLIHRPSSHSYPATDMQKIDIMHVHALCGWVVQQQVIWTGRPQ